MIKQRANTVTETGPALLTLLQITACQLKKNVEKERERDNVFVVLLLYFF